MPLPCSVNDTPELDLRNNVLMANRWGVQADGLEGPSEHGFNVVRGNDEGDWIGWSPTLDDLDVAPIFVDYEPGAAARLWDLHLHRESPLVDAGDPREDELDPDGTRADIGLYGGPQAGGVGLGLWPENVDLDALAQPPGCGGCSSTGGSAPVGRSALVLLLAGLLWRRQRHRA